jgi:filamentous hemagglutinin
VANIGGNLNLESLQDTTTFDSKQESAGFSVSLCIPPICYGSGSYSANYAKAGVKGDFASVTEQTGVKAGDGGFQVNVGGNTDLKGAVVTSTQAAVDAKANTLTTNSLTASSIDNHDVFKATSVSVSGGTGGGSGAAYQKSGDQRSTTESGISDTALNVAGTSTRNIDTTVRTDVDSSASLGKAWDGQKLQEQVTAGASVVAQFGATASKLVGDYASSKTKPLEDARNYEDYKERQANGEDIGKVAEAWVAKMDQGGYSIEQAKAVQSNPEVLSDYENWKEGGQYRVAAHAAVGGLSGNLQGALGAAASAAAVPGVAEAIDKMGLPEPLRKSVIALAGTAVGAAVGGGSGAAAAFNQTTNNYLKHEELQKKKKELAECKDEKCRRGVTEKWDSVSQQRNESMTSSCVSGDNSQCHANAAQLQADIAALTAGSGGRIDRMSPEERNNVKQAVDKYKTNLEELAARGNRALGTTLASPEDLYQAGFLTEGEAVALKQTRLGQAISVLGALALPSGTKANASKPAAGSEPSSGRPALATKEDARTENNMRRDDAEQYVNNAAPKDVPVKVVRQDNDFSATANDKGNPKAHVDESGNLIPPNPNGTGSVQTHVRGSGPANTPYTSTTDPKSTNESKTYGANQIEINTQDLQRDINSGKAPQDIVILSPARVQQELQQKIDAAQKRFDNNPSQKNADSLGRANDDLKNATRDGECLIKGCVPASYMGTPTPTTQRPVVTPNKPSSSASSPK